VQGELSSVTIYSYMSQMELEFAGPNPLTVSELTEQLKGLLEGHFGSVWVEGEVSNHGAPASGHHYFTLKDEGAQVRCIMFRHQAMYSNFLPEDGHKVLAHARISVYEPRGEYQLVVDRIEPLGVGALEIAFRELKEKLATEGLFDADRKKPVREFPRKVGVVTSGTGAAIRDILKTITSRSSLVDILVYPVKVQGEGAATQIAEAIKTLDSARNPWGKLDAIIVGRGGGSLEDLWAFNEEIVARAIAECRTPVISAVGHETDFSISDFVADERVATPTAAAQRVAPRQADIVHRFEVFRSRMGYTIDGILRHMEEKLIGLRRALPDPRRTIEERSIRLDELAARIERHLASEINLHAQNLGGLGTRLARAPLIERIDRRRAETDDAFRRLASSAAHRMDTADSSLRAVGARLGALNPLAVLDRGYAVARKEDGTIIRNQQQVQIGEDIKVTLSKGAVTAQVKKKEP